MGHCLLHQRSTHPGDQRRQGENLHVRGRGRFGPHYPCQVPSLLHHGRPGRGVRQQEPRRTEGKEGHPSPSSL